MGQLSFGTWGMFFCLFPEREMRAINQRWTEVAKDLHQFGYIPQRPDFGGPHQDDLCIITGRALSHLYQDRAAFNNCKIFWGIGISI